MAKPKMEDLLKLTIDKRASDLHIGVNSPPLIRIDEVLCPTEHSALSEETARELIYSMLSEKQVKQFEAAKELDFSFEVKNLSRFRVNVFVQRGRIAASIRAIPLQIMSFMECGLPAETVTSLCNKPKGLVLVTGATGSGKSTTLAAMIDYINEREACHIVTIEDPIEFVHQNKKALINQREVYEDTNSFAEALKHVLRQDPDVILIGEMRDKETMETALICAETGHLVFATLHTSDSVQTINRIIDVFPSHQQPQIRTQLSFVLQGVISQQLVPKTGGKGRVLATEMLIANPAIRSMIREAKVHQLFSTLQTSQREGMYTMNQSLFNLCRQNLIAFEEAISRTLDVEDLQRLFKK